MINEKDSQSKMYLQYAIEIGNDLLKKSDTDGDGLCWLTTYSTIGERDINYKYEENIYNGTSGIALLFLELFQATRDDKYKLAAEQAINWSIKYVEKNNNDIYSFYTGRMSIVFVLIKAHEILGSAGHLANALKLTKNVRNFLDYKVNDLLGGISGTLLVLLHLYAATYESWVLDEIRAFTTKLIDNARIDKRGIYWDRKEDEIKPLCGLSHGASGIGFVFLELGSFFQNKQLIWIAEKAFSYERQYFNDTNNNWPDFRHGMVLEQDREVFYENYINNNIDFFSKFNYAIAWCHGSPGIGLVRNRAFNLLNNPIYKYELEAAINSTSKGMSYGYPLNNFSLCHGILGNAELFLEAFRHEPNEEYLDIVYKAVENCMYNRKQLGYYPSGIGHAKEDNSLFLGTAGIAHTLLRIYNPSVHSSILLPIVNESNKPELNFNELTIDSIKRQFLEKIFKRSFILIEYLFPEETQEYLLNEIDSSDLFESWRVFVNNKIERGRYNNQIAEIFNYESFVFDLDYSIPSNMYLYYNKAQIKKKAFYLLRSPKVVIGKTKLITRTDIIVKTLSWKWPENSNKEIINNLTCPPSSYTYILMPMYKGVREMRVNNSLFLSILDVFKIEKTIQEGIDIIISSFEDINSEDDMIEVNKIVFSQLEEALMNSFFYINEE